VDATDSGRASKSVKSIFMIFPRIWMCEDGPVQTIWAAMAYNPIVLH
jgi:hypothetical protein